MELTEFHRHILRYMSRALANQRIPLFQSNSINQNDYNLHSYSINSTMNNSIIIEHLITSFMKIQYTRMRHIL